MFWVNADVPDKKLTLHRTTCAYLPANKESTRKGLGTMKQDGGWFRFSSQSQARAFADSQAAALADFQVIECSNCFLGPD